MAFDFYRSRLPHVRIQGATYFVTWRLQKAQAELSEVERALVAESLRHFDGRRYLLHAYVVMNDHVHVLVEPRAAFRLESIVQSWKSFSAKRIGTLRVTQRAGRDARPTVDRDADNCVSRFSLTE